MTAMFFTKQLAAMNAPRLDFAASGGHMWIHSSEVRLELRHGDHLRLNCASGARLTSIEGTAWITVDRDSQDMVLPAGDSFVVTSNRPVLVGALSGALTLKLEDTGGTVAKAAPKSNPRDQNLYAPE